MQNKIRFKIGDIAVETTGCETALVKAIKGFSNLLKNIEYSGSLREKNSRQLDIHLDKAVSDILKINKWSYEKTPRLDMSIFGEKWANPEADFITTPPDIGGYRIVIEIEKANKKTLWFDFIKHWMFIEAKQAEAGVLVCPQNYSHTHGVWNLYEEACRYKRYLSRFAKVAEEKINLIAIIGYQQMVHDGAKYKVWNADEFNRAKRIT